MANTATGKGEPAKQVAIDILRKAGEPLHANEIAKRVLASGRCAGLKGKTPEATISAMLAVGSKPGGPFARVDKGTYTVSDVASTTAANTQRQTRAVAKPKPTPTRKKAPAAKVTSQTRPKRAAAKRTR